MAGGHRTMAVTSGRHVLVVAGSDSSGGAGIARDVETIAAFGLRACLAVTAVTVQTHGTVERVEQMPADLIAAQMRAAFASNAIVAVKIGMLGSVDAVTAVASVLASRLPLPVVLDPVLASTSGRALLPMAAVDILKCRLMPLCTLVTPNLPELALLSAKPLAADEAGIISQSGPLFESGVPALLVKGGHAGGDRSVDLLLRASAKPSRFEAPRLDVSMRGTGCMLASAIAAGLGLGDDLPTAVGRAKDHVFERLERDGQRTGRPASQVALL
ncbi:hydroxymethylpyrimidine/phosphomethylpyrimidine kinase [Mesorhizobium amorphae]|uniref:hydroxymethylpyrimidine/phosphomethylpyrimidine kinase n=1 Tax=Mesorhizobium amorphae TaxID=71433 RepID=UPI0021B32F70|nr:hydroxymethylpyrimidine/phosphomethylpyrimidine kinase [Mesorhizobium amorphae]